jgi:hypothetical protein
MGGTGSDSSDAPSSSACSSSQPLCSAPAAVPSARKDSQRFNSNTLINGEWQQTKQIDAGPCNACNKPTKGQRAIYPTLASTNLPSFLVDPCFPCAKDTTKKPAELEHACTGIVVCTPFSSATHQHSAHHLAVELKATTGPAGTERNKPVHDGAMQSSCRPSSRSISSMDAAALPLSIFLQSPNTNTSFWL